MTSQTIQPSNDLDAPHWLKIYYYTRASVSVAWVAAAFTVGENAPPVAAALLVAYPLWDAVANVADARSSGGLINNPTQALNAAVSIAATLLVLIALGYGMHAVLAVFGAWAVLSGLFQLLTGVRRWKRGAQWAMILSGAQSMLAGGFFISIAIGPGTPGIADIAPYAAVGAFYFLVSAVWLTVKLARRG